MFVVPDLDLDPVVVLRDDNPEVIYRLVTSVRDHHCWKPMDWKRGVGSGPVLKSRSSKLVVPPLWRRGTRTLPAPCRSRRIPIDDRLKFIGPRQTGADDRIGAGEPGRHGFSLAPSLLLLLKLELSESQAQFVLARVE